MKNISVLFLSVQPSILAAIISMLNADPFILADADSYENLNKRNKKYDVVVYDDNALSKNEEMVLMNTVHNNNTFRRILYTSIADKEYLNQFIYAGLDGIASQRANPPVVKEAIQKVFTGIKYRCKEVEKILCEVSNEYAALSKLEKEVLSYILQSFSNESLVTAPLNTNRNTKIMEKTGVVPTSSKNHTADTVITLPKSKKQLIVPIVLPIKFLFFVSRYILSFQFLIVHF